MTEQMGEDPRDLDRRRFLKRAALGVADAFETAARLVGAPGLGPKGRARERLDQPDDVSGDPMFQPARRPSESNSNSRGQDSSAEPSETT